MTNIEKFEAYLRGKMNYITSTITVLSNSRDFDNLDEKDFLMREKILMEDIIHHFELFVKGDSEDV